MSWLHLQRLRLWWEGAFWVIPLLGIAAGYLLDLLSVPIDESLALDAEAATAISPAAAVTLLAAIGGGMITFTGFVFSVILLMVQFGSSQYSPRTVSYFLRARGMQWVLAVFLATIVFPFLSLVEIGSGERDEYVPLGSIALSILLLVISLVAFLALIHVVSQKIRVDSVLSSLGRRARADLARRGSVLGAGGPSGALDAAPQHGDEAQPIPFTGRPGQVVSIDVARLRRVADRRGARIVMRVRVGDAVVTGTRVAVSEGGGGIRPGELSRCLLVQDERSLRHDPLYALRLLTDVSLRALSPGINDPTTAVRALDEVEGVLRAAAELPLGTVEVAGRRGSVVLRGPTWSDILAVALFEVTSFGAEQPQVTRRLAAMLDDLADDVPGHRTAAVAEARARLAEQVAAAVPQPDRAMALTPDLQGIGGSRSARTV